MPIRVVAVMLSVPLALVSPVGLASAQTPTEIAELKRQIEELRATQLAIQKDVQEIKAILLRVTEPPPGRGPVTDVSLDVPVAGRPMKGNAQATVAIVEFSDYQCPFCGRYVAQTLPRIASEYIESGKIQYFFVNFPIESLHPQAFRAHEAAICAGEQGKFWEMHDRLFANQRALAPEDLAGHAKAIGLDLEAYEPCFESGRTASQVREDQALGQRAGVGGTPLFLVGTIEPGATSVQAVKAISGAQPFALFKQTLDEVLGRRD